MQWCALDATLQIVDGSINIKYLKNSGIVNVNITSMWLCFQYANVRIFQVWNLCVHKGPFLVVWGFQMQNIESQDTMTCSGCNTGTGTVLGLKYFSTGVPDIILFAMSRVEWWICSSQRSSVLELTRWSGNLQQLGWKLLQVVCHSQETLNTLFGGWHQHCFDGFHLFGIRLPASLLRACDPCMRLLYILVVTFSVKLYAFVTAPLESCCGVFVMVPWSSFIRYSAAKHKNVISNHFAFL